MRARVRERIRVCVGAMRGGDVCMRTHRRAAGLPVRRTKQTPRAGHGATSGSKAHACWAATSHLYLEGAESSAMSGATPKRDTHTHVDKITWAQAIPQYGGRCRYGEGPFGVAL